MARWESLLVRVSQSDPKSPADDLFTWIHDTRTSISLTVSHLDQSFFSGRSSAGSPAWSCRTVPATWSTPRREACSVPRNHPTPAPDSPARRQTAEVKMVGYITISSGTAQRLSEKWHHFACTSVVAGLCSDEPDEIASALCRAILEADVLWQPRRSFARYSKVIKCYSTCFTTAQSTGFGSLVFFCFGFNKSPDTKMFPSTKRQANENLAKIPPTAASCPVAKKKGNGAMHAGDSSRSSPSLLPPAHVKNNQGRTKPLGPPCKGRAGCGTVPMNCVATKGC